MRYAALSLVMLAITLVSSSPCDGQIAWEGKLRDAHDKAQQQNKLLLLHFYTDNCIYCDRLEAGAFQDPAVSTAVNLNFIPVKVHGGKNPKLAKLFKVTKYPTDVIVTTDGKALSHSVSPQHPGRYVAMLSNTYSSFTKSSAMIAAARQPAPAPNAPAAPTAAQPGPAATQMAAVQTPPQPSSQTPQPTTATSPAGMTAPVASANTVASPGTTVPQAETLAANTGRLDLPAGDLPVQVRVSTAKPADGGTKASPQTNQFMLPAADVASTNNPTAMNASMAAARIERESSPSIDTKSPEKPELAIQGYCAVSVVKDGQWIEGKPELGVVHLGKLYLFANEAAMQAFLVDPMPFTPMLNEIDVVRFFEEKKIVKGNREWGVIDPVHNRMFFFADEKAMLHFEQSFERYVDAAIEVMDQAVQESNPGV